MSSPSTEIQRKWMVLFMPPCSSCPWGIDWPISITPGHWRCVSCHKLYCGACRYKPGCLAAPEAQREHWAAPYSWVQCWPPAKAARAPALQVWLCPLPLFWSPRCGQIAPTWAAAKQRDARAGSMRAARTGQAGTHVSIDVAFTFLVLSLFILLSLLAPPLSPGGDSSDKDH